MDHITQRAVDVLKNVRMVAGYTTYIDIIRPIIGDKEVISTPMKKEVDRVESAIEVVLNGKDCAVVSSGDAGIYAMAGLVFEMCRIKEIPIFSSRKAENSEKKNPSIRIEVVPGVPALAAGASLLGAPLTHDFAAISLSDLLTPWEKIEKRLEAVAMADFVIVIYNPKSKKRDWQLKAAQDMILRYRDRETPVGIVGRAMRDGQSIEIATLENLDKAAVDMQTTVFIGNSSTFTYENSMVTPRGYSKKYDI